MNNERDRNPPCETLGEESDTAPQLLEGIKRLAKEKDWLWDLYRGH